MCSKEAKKNRRTSFIVKSQYTNSRFEYRWLRALVHKKPLLPSLSPLSLISSKGA